MTPQEMLDAYSLPLANPRDRKPTFVSDTFFRGVLPNLTYGLTKEELVSFAERQSTPNSRTPNSQPSKSTANKNFPSQFFSLRRGRSYGIIDMLNPSDAQGSFCRLRQVV